MRNSKPKKLTALVLALVMLIGSTVTVFAADGDSGTAGTQSNSLTELSSDYALISYESYKTKYNYSTDMRTGKEATISAVDYVKDPEVTTAEVEETTVDGADCILVSESGSVSWKIDIPETGWYCVRFVYRAANDRTTDIERVFKINGKAPYSEARYQNMNKIWDFDYAGDPSQREGVFELDTTGNELRPAAVLSQEWIEYSVKDTDGYYTTPLEFYLEKGENTITLDGVRDKAYFAEVGVYTYEELPTYEDVLKEYESKGYEPADADSIYFEAETPDKVSNYTIYPIYDRSSAITSPQDKSKILRNTMGGDKWVANGQWIRYSFECEESGLYQIGIRFSQDVLKGMYTSRAIRIDGEYPFEEAKACQFPYDNKWQIGYLGDGNNEFQFYLEKGKHTIELEVCLGSLSDVVRQVDSVVESLNDDYMRIVELTGADPDEYRDYGFARVMPDVIADLGIQSSILYQLVDYISEINGIKSDNTSTLEQTAVLVEKMSSDEKEIAANLSSLKEWVSSLGTWLSDVSTQYLEMDYIIIQPAGSELPRGESNGWQSFWFEMQKFFASFYTDYNAIGADSENENAKTLEVWTTSGRDQAQIIKNLVNNGYTPEYNTNVNLKLVAGGTLLPAILAGVGPDASIDATNPLDMAIRGAVLPLNDYDTFDEVMSRFADSAKEPLTLYGVTYAIPTTQSFPVMFCRDDILAELGLEIPETWDDLMSLVPVLQFNNMDIGMTQDHTIFLYQAGGEYWKNEGMSINFDDYITLDSFEYMCNFFTQFSLPITYNGENRFKTGEMPIIISGYAFYNTLVVFAPEISGLWSFYEIPGTLNKETGEVDHTSVSAISGVIIPRGTSDEETAWTFLDWYSDKDFQVDYSNEMMALLGPSAKPTVANLEAFEELPWSESEAATLRTCLDHTVAIVPYPGNYYVGRYAGFAFNAAYNDKEDPSDELLGYVDTINKELTRKRKEFDLMIDDEWQAIKDYMGFESFNEWKEYWAELNDIDIDGDTTYIQDNRDGAKEYTYVNWMNEHDITVDSHVKWMNAVKYDGETRTYKEWVEK